MIEKIKEKLFLNQDLKYKEFSQSLLPNTNNVIGVRLPVLRKLAKEIYKENFELFIQENSNDFFELTMLEGMIIGQIQNFSMLEKYIKTFVPKINNWSICDSFCVSLKTIKNHKKETKLLLEKYFNSQKEFEIRFAFVILIYYFTEEIDYILNKIKNFNNDKYYAKMAVSWCLAEILSKDFNKVLDFIKTCSLDKSTLKKALTKAIESNKISKEEKELIKKLRNSL